MNLDTTNWKTFKVSDLFLVKYGVNLELNTCEESSDKDNSINFVARKAENNGVSAHVKPIDTVQPQESGLISVAGGGSVLSTFLQTEPFYSGRDLYTLKSKDHISNEVKLFIITIIEQNKYKYSYGRQANKTLPDLLLKLPVDNHGKPDYQFMEQYIKSLHYKPLTTKNKLSNVVKLNTISWKDFRIGDVFPKTIVKHFSSIPEIEGTVPFVSSKSNNNGIDSFVEADAIAGNCITVSTNGDCFDCFYQPEAIAVSNDVEVLYTPKLNQYNALFIITVMRLEKQKYGYGRKAKNGRVYDTIIRLPSTKEGQPDWQYMEDYIKSLPYGDLI